MNLSAEYYRASTLTPEWIAYSNKVKQRDNFTCVGCKTQEGPLHAHHKYYVDKRLPWEYPLSALETLCGSCHTGKHLKKIRRYFEGDMELIKIENPQLYQVEIEKAAAKKIQNEHAQVAAMKVFETQKEESSQRYRKRLDNVLAYIFITPLIVALISGKLKSQSIISYNKLGEKEIGIYILVWIASFIIVGVIIRLFRALTRK
jgi:hypothetical protein